MDKDKNNKTWKVSSFSLIVVFVALSIVGLALFPLLSLKLSPTLEVSALNVSFEMPGNSARVVEAVVTSKLEAMFSRISGVKSIQSSSDNGRGNLLVVLDDYADAQFVRFEVSTLIRQLWPELPDGISYPLISTENLEEKTDVPFLTYTINAPVSPVVLQNYGENRIKPALSAIKGVHRVALSGAPSMIWLIEYNNEQLSSLGVTVSAVEEAILQRYSKAYLGACNYPDKDSENWIRTVCMAEGTEESFIPSEILVKSEEGICISLDKLVSVERVEEEPVSFFRINGKNSVYISLVAKEGVNQLLLASKVKKAMQDILATLPEGYSIHTSYDATKFIRNELKSIFLRTGLAVVFLLLLVSVVTRDVKLVFLIVSSLIVNLVIAVIFYYMLGLELHLYSLAGITVSLNLLLNNVVIMIDHIRRRNNLKSFLPVLAATLSITGSLAVLYFLDERIRLNIEDFVTVIIVNLFVSLAVCLFFVPSMMERMKIKADHSGCTFSRIKRLKVIFTLKYRNLLMFVCRHRIAVCFMLLLCFGLPVFLIPKKIENPEEKGKWAVWYNKVFDNYTFNDKIHPALNRVLGGSLYLFKEAISDSRGFSKSEREVVMVVNATLPSGSTLAQMNAMIREVERFLDKFEEIELYQTTIGNANNATIQIHFKKEVEHGGFPYALKRNLVAQLTRLGGGSWNISGLEDAGFNNNVHETVGTYCIKMNGYNYDELNQWADMMKNRLLRNNRIKEVNINSEYSYMKSDYSEYFLELDRYSLARENLSSQDLFNALNSVFMRKRYLGNIVYDKKQENLYINSQQGINYDIFGLMSVPIQVKGKNYKLSDFAHLERKQVSGKIVKENQQYSLYLQYEYLGSFSQGNKVLKSEVAKMKDILPMGYTVQESKSNWTWNQQDNQHFFLIFIVIVILFFITAVLFDSLKLPFAVLFTIPVSCIGVFLTFGYVDMGFDLGGLVSFVLICGMTVNSSIYLLNEYNVISKNCPNMPSFRAYTKAWNTKIVPVSVTILSTILGFLPFLVGGTTAFWSSLAVGTIGGLLASLFGIFLCLPMFGIRR